MTVLVPILLAAGFTYAVALCAGRLVFQQLGVRLGRSEENFLAFLLGSACLSLLVFAVSAAGLAYHWVFLAVGVLILAAGFRRGAHKLAADVLPPIPLAWRATFWLVFLGFTVYYLSIALSPEVSPGGLSDHLGLVARYFREHRLSSVTWDMRASLPQSIEMLFLFAFAFGKHPAAAMVHYLFLLTLPFGILAYGRRMEQPVAGVVGALLFYLSPIAGKDGTRADVDVAVAAVLFALFYLLQIWREEKQKGLVVPIGILAGFAFAAMYTAFLAVPFALGFLAFFLWRNRERMVKPLLVAGCGALAMAAPWMIRNAVVVGNPFAPLLNHYFPNPYFYESSEATLREAFGYVGGVRLAQIAPEVTIRGAKLHGLIGPLFLLFPLALLSLRRRMGRQVLIPAVVFLVPYFGNVGTRFLLPALPFVSLALAAALCDLRAMAPLALAFHALTCWPSMISRYCDDGAWRLERIQWAAALRRVPEETFIRSHCDDYDIGLILDRVVPAGDKILSGSMGRLAYHSRDVVSTTGSAFGTRMSDVMNTAWIENMQPTWRHEFRFPERRLRRLRLVETRRSPALRAISEIRVFQGDRALAPASDWRLRASSNRWETALAVDGKPITLWNARRAAGPGMFFEIDFGRDQAIDRLEADVAHNESSLGWRLEGETAAGRWETLQDRPVAFDIPAPPDSRRAAVAELRANGIRWLVVHDRESCANDYLKHAAEWGMTETAYSNGYRLWRLN